MTDRMQTVQGHCPACGNSTLFLADGGHVTCSLANCPKPEAADELLHREYVTESTNTLLTNRMVASAALYNTVLVRALNAEAAVDRIRARHQRDERGGTCTTCGVRWPCPEICTLNGPPCGPDCADWHATATPAPTPATEATGAWTPTPPGDRREQLPDGILAAIDIPRYISTACQAADLCADAIPIRMHIADELGQWTDRLHARCRINNKFTGQLCACGCHQERPAPAATQAATLDDILLDRCPHCPERVPRSQLDDHVDTVHADLPPCTAAFDTGLDLVLCAFRVGHKDGEYGDWHATARDAMGRTVWNDGAIGASPHHTQEQP